MKDCIIDRVDDAEKHILSFYLDGVSRDEIIGLVEGLSLESFAMPAKHSMKSTWQLRVVFSEGFSLEFSSVPADIGDWEEMGSLSIRYVDKSDETDSEIFIHNRLQNFKVKKILSLIYDSEKVFSESGIIFVSESGKEIVIVCGISPGSVSMKAPDSSIDEIDAELDYKDYKITRWCL